MKIYDCSVDGPKERQPGESETLLDRFKSVRRKTTAYDLFVQALKSVLDNRFATVFGAAPPGLGGPLPLVLVGPTGLWLVLISPAKGVFRASEENWDQLDERSGGYKPAKPNPLGMVIEKAQKLASHFEDKQIGAPQIEPVVYFSDPGAHVETMHPAAHVVLVDGVQRFITAILTSPVVLDGDAIQAIVDDLIDANGQVKKSDIRDMYSLREPPAPKKPRQPTRLEEASREEPKIVRWLSRYLPFDRRQWVLIGILLLVNFFVLILLVIVIAVNT